MELKKRRKNIRIFASMDNNFLLFFFSLVHIDIVYHKQSNDKKGTWSSKWINSNLTTINTLVEHVLLLHHTHTFNFFSLGFLQRYWHVLCLANFCKAFSAGTEFRSFYTHTHTKCISSPNVPQKARQFISNVSPIPYTHTTQIPISED